MLNVEYEYLELIWNLVVFVWMVGGVGVACGYDNREC